MIYDEDGGVEILPINDDAEFERLAKLDSVAYDREREKAAKRLNIRVGTLDAEVAKLRPAAPHAGGENTILFDDLDPWPEPVSGDALLTELVGIIGRYMVTPPGGAETVAVWSMLAHVFDNFSVVPRLAIQSPVLGSGKTTLLTIVQYFVPRPLVASNISPAAVFRVIEAAHPTLLIDEADTFVHDNPDLRGVLNSGHNKAAAYVIRVEGDAHDVKRFSTWCPMAIALINKLPDTLESRSIVVRLERKRPDQHVEPLRLDRLGELHQAARKIARWAADASFDADPAVPVSLQNRNADNWRPLFAIADRCGKRWAERLREIAIAANGDRDLDTKELLLADIQAMFTQADDANLSSVNICNQLAAMEERPWPEWKQGKPMTTRQLSAQLKPFKILPSTVRIGAATAKGYKCEQFKNVWASYVPPSQSVTPAQTAVTNGCSGFERVTPESNVTDENGLKPALSNGCDIVTDRKRGDGGEGGNHPAETDGDIEREAIMAEGNGQAAYLPDPNITEAELPPTDYQKAGGLTHGK